MESNPSKGMESKLTILPDCTSGPKLRKGTRGSMKPAKNALTATTSSLHNCTMPPRRVPKQRKPKLTLEAIEYALDAAKAEWDSVKAQILDPGFKNKPLEFRNRLIERACDLRDEVSFFDGKANRMAAKVAFVPPKGDSKRLANSVAMPSASWDERK
jgi:hypothetical protein